MKKRRKENSKGIIKKVLETFYYGAIILGILILIGLATVFLMPPLLGYIFGGLAT